MLLGLPKFLYLSFRIGEVRERAVDFGSYP
jgi:hypothetical protein